MKNSDIVSNSGLHTLSKTQLIQEIKRIRHAVKRHECQEGNDRCWLDDEQLYETIIPNYIPRVRVLPPKDEFLRNCEHFHDCRQKKEFGSIDEIFLRQDLLDNGERLW